MRRHGPEERCPATGKLGYSHADARTFARVRRRRSGERVAEYRCRLCEWWHVGHVLREPRRTRKVRLRSRADGDRRVSSTGGAT